MAIPRIYNQLSPLDPMKLYLIQVDNVYRPLKAANSGATFIPAQFGGLINQQQLLSERDVLNFTSLTPGT